MHSLSAAPVGSRTYHCFVLNPKSCRYRHNATQLHLHGVTVDQHIHQREIRNNMIIFSCKSTLPKGLSNYFELRHQTVPSLEHFSKLQDPLRNC